MTCSAEFYPAESATQPKRTVAPPCGKSERRTGGACPCGVLGASRRDSPSFLPGGCLRRRLSATVGINSFLQEKLNRNFGALFLCRRAAGCRRFPDDAVRCRACGACGIREVQNAGRRIVNSELFFYLCNRIVGFSRLDGPIAQSVRAADS